MPIQEFDCDHPLRQRPLPERFRIRVGEDVLFFPFAVRLTGLDPDAISHLMDKLESTLGAQFFREKELSLEVAMDMLAEDLVSPHAYRPRKNPVLRVWSNGAGMRQAATSVGEPGSSSDLGGYAVYALDQINAHLDQIEREASAGAAIRPRMRQ